VNAKFKIIILPALFLLLNACQGNEDVNKYKKEVATILSHVDSLKPEDHRKEKKLDQLYRYVSKHKNDSVNRNFYFKVAHQYFEMGKLDKYITAVKKVNELAIKDKDTTHIAKSLYYFGDYYEEKNQLDSAFSYYSKSEKFYRSINDTLNIGKTTLYKAGILYDAGSFIESEVELVAALKLLTKTNNTRLVYECYNLMAMSIEETNNHQKALDYFGLALKKLDQLENEGYPKTRISKSKVSIYNNMGSLYEKTNNHNEAIRLYKIGLKTTDLKQNYPKLYTMLLSNLAYSEMKSGSVKGIKEKFFESLKIRDSLDIKSGIVSGKIAIGEYYLHVNDTAKAFVYLKDGLVLSKKIKSSYDIINALKLLTENDLKNKAYYSNLYIEVSDSIRNAERITRNKFARIAYETDRIEDENQLLTKQITYIVTISGIVIAFLIVFFLIFKLKSKNKELRFNKAQQEANEKIYQLMLKQQLESEKAREEERNRIAMELHDGIVNSIFTTRFNLLQLDANHLEKKQQLVQELEKTENQVRRVSHDLKQKLLFEDKNLPEITTQLIQSQQNQYHTVFDLSIDKYINWSLVSGNSKIHVYRIIQEAIQNVNKYSEAQKCYIMILKTAHKITIRIWDDGIGFNPEKNKQGIGIKNITERVKALNGELRITSKNGKGTNIEVIF